MHTPELPEDRWRELVNRLRGSLPRMQDEFVERVAKVAEYSDEAVSLPDLRETAAVSIGLIIDALSGKQHYPRMLHFGSELGTRRARQGLSADAVMSAVRLDFPVIWSTLLEEAEDEDAVLLASRAADVWRVVEDYAHAARSSYIETRSQMAQEEAGVRQKFIAALFGAQGRLQETRERFAKTFEVPSECPYEIAAATGRGAEQLRSMANLPNRRSRIFTYEAEDYVYVFWPEAGSGVRTPDMRAELRSVPCGLAWAGGGLKDLPAAARISAALADLADPLHPGPSTVETDWPRLARTRMDSIGVELGAVLARQLGRLREDERERVKETVECFLRSGSVSAAADELYCHRNTILNRLRRFREMTGLDVTVPVQAARVVVACS
ncbi:helix-turn-helix domain-containing protein [Nesterenkonia flava]|uniref:Helix-turn-helix domain-containing protein n=1 Tax=Nesterenkonia flava TaxID=469799 RepID=A0ABU1FVP4_9MICC|nr:helix-turn-helix domain-containing protein [Nesterenkonia flava]MDR5712248.1 helix-turn-helix domain-containing protein [Nesterenkonia flava]